MSAYEELKAWCEKHLPEDEYKVVPESKSYCTVIYINPDRNEDIPCFVFTSAGDYHNSSSCSEEDMLDHIEDYENGAQRH